MSQGTSKTKSSSTKRSNPNLKVNVAQTSVTYRVSQVATHHEHSLVDRGANGGIAGENVRIIAKSDRAVNVTGLGDHQVTDLHIVSAGGVVPTQRGEVIVILHQYAYMPTQKTIHSSTQLEHFKNAVDDRSTKVQGATQSITTVEGYVIPLRFRNGLPYMPIRPYSDQEWNDLPHVVLTSDEEWDPKVMDEDRDEDEWLANQPENPTGFEFRPFNHVGDYIIHVGETGKDIVPLPRNWSLNMSKWLEPSEVTEYLQVQIHEIWPKPKRYKRFQPYFLFSDPAVIRKTFEHTTQYARAGIIQGRITDTHRAPFPALNVHRRNEPVATDTVYADTPSFDGGYTIAQFFVGCHTNFCYVHGMTTDSQFVSTLMEEISKRGAMDQLISDRAQVEISKKALDILRHLCIDDWQSEPHYQHQNYAERRYREVKHKTNRVLNETGAPDRAWLHCMRYVCFILNRMSLQSLGWKTPFEKLSGQTPDISMIYRFHFWERVYFANRDSRRGKNFPSQSDEKSGRFLGFSEDVGHQMTYLVLDDETKRVIHRSRIRSATRGENRRLLMPPGESDNDDSESDSGSSSDEDSDEEEDDSGDSGDPRETTTGNPTPAPDPTPDPDPPNQDSSEDDDSTSDEKVFQNW